ncbi:hypothetical protein ETD86_50665 [Nonomuraea turkmeniaca]|uniref:Uncharacterized protein n=1 Tax=Nonomuraea turkmeniaca TaxID=103838 RepID=A0A5S4EWC5_9ACTN|nr:hypothetical protein [Nonomuraea turkmeniaca]TMR07750.1 hypothetical protein ETD86_50665 [Nonomuraea turkmeniaca]
MTTERVIRDHLDRHPVTRAGDSASHRFLIRLHGGENAWNPSDDDLPFAGPAVISYERSRATRIVTAEAFLDIHRGWSVRAHLHQLRQAGIAAESVVRVDEHGASFYGVRLMPEAPATTDGTGTGRRDEQPEEPDRNTCPGCGERCDIITRGDSYGTIVIYS